MRCAKSRRRRSWLCCADWDSSSSASAAASARCIADTASCACANRSPRARRAVSQAARFGQRPHAIVRFGALVQERQHAFVLAFRGRAQLAPCALELAQRLAFRRGGVSRQLESHCSSLGGDPAPDLVGEALREQNRAARNAPRRKAKRCASSSAHGASCARPRNARTKACWRSCTSAPKSDNRVRGADRIARACDTSAAERWAERLAQAHEACVGDAARAKPRR